MSHRKPAMEASKEDGTVSVKLWFSTTEKGKDTGYWFTGHIKDYMAASGSKMWQVLENAKDGKEFLRVYKKVEDKISGEQPSTSASSLYDFQDRESESTVEEEEGPPKVSKERSQRKKKEVPEEKKKKKQPGTSSGSESSEEEEITPKVSKKGRRRKEKEAKKKDQPGTTKPKRPFQEEVKMMRQLHPDRETAEDNVPLDRNAPNWRDKVKELTEDEYISSTKPTAIMVACMSQRCFTLAEDIMQKWKQGFFKGQKTRNVSQALFQCLCGLGDEDRLFHLLEEFGRGEMKKAAFESAAKQIKDDVGAPQEDHLTENSVKEQLKARVATLEAENSRLQTAMSTLQEDKELLKTRVATWEAENSALWKQVDSLTKEKKQLETRVATLLKRPSGEETGSATKKRQSGEETGTVNKKRSSGEETGTATKKRNTVFNWEGKEVRPGQLVAVAYGPRPCSFYVGTVLPSTVEKKGGEEEEVLVQFYKTQRKVLVKSGKPEGVRPKFVLDTNVSVDNNGPTLSPPSKSEENRLKEKLNVFFSVQNQ